jgi:hypothetical protein
MTPKALAVATAFRKNLALHYDFESIVNTFTDENDESVTRAVLAAFFGEEFYKISNNDAYCCPIDFVSASGAVVVEGKMFAMGGLKLCDSMSGGVAVTTHKVTMLELAIGAVPRGYSIVDPNFAQHGIYAYLDANRCVWIITVGKIAATKLQAMRHITEVAFDNKWGPNRSAKFDRDLDPDFEPTFFIPSHHWRCIGRMVDNKIEIFEEVRQDLPLFDIQFEQHKLQREAAIRRYG